ncbi:MAG: nitrate reductase molybdenum cofactor assembly chaperone [Thermaerobacter sp.]|jgi:nitrate reductase delta subunit|nr:nitrate reductase molybdenum cofactor assembly chaperone [Thermaerobacter sp.]
MGSRAVAATPSLSRVAAFLASSLAYPAAAPAPPAPDAPSLPSPISTDLERFAAWRNATPLEQQQELYVASFDLNPQRSLHLTYHRHADRPERGAALAELAHRLREAGRPAVGELPDHLPLLLELAAKTPLGWEILREYRAEVAVLSGRLSRADHPYAPLFSALGALLEPALAEGGATKCL